MDGGYSLKTLVEEAGLMKLLAKLTVDRRYDALDLSHGKHAAKERISGIIPAVLITQHSHSVVNAHRQTCRYRIVSTPLLFFLEDMCKLYDVCTPAKVTCFGEIAIREDVA